VGALGTDIDLLGPCGRVSSDDPLAVLAHALPLARLSDWGRALSRVWFIAGLTAVPGLGGMTVTLILLALQRLRRP